MSAPEEGTDNEKQAPAPNELEAHIKRCSYCDHWSVIERCTICGHESVGDSGISVEQGLIEALAESRLEHGQALDKAREYWNRMAELEKQLTAATERARGLEKRQEWSDDDERPPDDDRYVELFTAVWDAPVIGWWDASDKTWNDIHGLTLNYVTHWREIGPLPATESAK